MKISEIHIRLTKQVLPKLANEDDALAMMLLLHTHRIRLSEAILEDRPGVVELAAITQRQAAEAVAASWLDRDDFKRTACWYWYHEFDTRTPYEIVEDIPELWRERVQQFRQKLSNLPAVSSVDIED